MMVSSGNGIARHERVAYMIENTGELAHGMEVRFVVLHHTGYEWDHYDLMLEVPGREKLMTWQISIEPARWDGDLGGQRIADHRRDYMTYEGEISGGRGQVKRVLAGKATVDNPQGHWVGLMIPGLPEIFLETVID